jgi:hypothetical protein
MPPRLAFVRPRAPGAAPLLAFGHAEGFGLFEPEVPGEAEAGEAAVNDQAGSQAEAAAPRAPDTPADPPQEGQNGGSGSPLDNPERESQDP